MNSQLSVIGFSQDGRYLAYQFSGHYHGHNISFSTLRIVDVDRNAFKEKPIKTEIDFEPDPADRSENGAVQKMTFKKAVPLLKKYKIITGNTGTLVFDDHLDTGRIESWNKTSVKAARFSRGKDEISGKPYMVKLKEFATAPRDCGEALKAYGVEPKIFELTLSRQEQAKILQKDSTLYRSRHCPYEYSIHRVYLYKDKIVVFLHSWTIGFEGPNIYKLVVTGTLLD